MYFTWTILFAEQKVVVSAHPAISGPHVTLHLVQTNVFVCSLLYQFFAWCSRGLESCQACPHQVQTSQNEAARLRKGAKQDGNGVCRCSCDCSLEGSPCSCLASSDGIPGSVPSDCRLAPLPPSLSHTQTSPINCSSLIFISPMWGSEAFAYPQFTLWKWTLLTLLFLSVSHLFFTCVYQAVLGPSSLDLLSVFIIHFCFPSLLGLVFFFVFFFKGGPPSRNPVVLTGDVIQQKSRAYCPPSFVSTRAPAQTAAHAVGQGR